MSAALKTAGPDMAAIIEAAHSQHIRPASLRWTDALREVRADPTDPDRAIVAAILALEDLASAAKETAATLRRELAATMEHDGTLAYEAPHHTITRKAAAQLVQINDRKALAAAHPELMIPQEDEPDKKAIGKLLRAKKPVAGCTLSNGGPSVITISAKGSK